MLDTRPYLGDYVFPALQRAEITTLQVNLGYRCNQQCQHCHVNAGPKRHEMMTESTLMDIVRVLEAGKIQCLDLTGGAPELHPRFRWLVERARQLGIHTIDRCNLTILTEPGQEDLAEFLAAMQVEVIASLPCYLEENVDTQRGKGTYIRSIEGLKMLNGLGYGEQDSPLVLNLVYNPVTASLPPSQQQLEADYRRYLFEHHEVNFSHLYTLANMPIKRFGSMLLSKHEFADYMQLLMSSHQDANLEHVMCKNQLSVDWQGYLFDCDFNQMLGMNITRDDEQAMTISDFINNDVPPGIRVSGHCYGCTAGQGSSCGGALA